MVEGEPGLSFLDMLNFEKGGYRTHSVVVKDVTWLSQFGKLGSGYLYLTTEHPTIHRVHITDVPPITTPGERVVLVTSGNVADDVQEINSADIKLFVVYDKDGAEKAKIFKRDNLFQQYRKLGI